MKRLRLLRWSSQVAYHRTRSGSHFHLRSFHPQARSFAAVALQTELEEFDEPSPTSAPYSPSISFGNDRIDLPSPPVEAASESPKLSALHARLSLPRRLPLQTLARTLVDPSADPSPLFNNSSFSTLGGDLMSYYTSEHVVCNYPRLPLAVVYAAMYAYIGPKSLYSISKGWGVESAAEPGGEVDAGLLQFQRMPPNAELQSEKPPDAYGPNTSHYRRGVSMRTVYDDEFGDPRQRSASKEPEDPLEITGVTEEKASHTFVRALMGALYLHGGRPAARQFFKEHITSRKLEVADLFNFHMPTRDLSRLCARESLESPVARILSETGRKSRHPVFIVGVFSGSEKLGEGAGSSLDEARQRAAVAALKAWYLYRPLDVRLPSETSDEGAKPWKPVMVDSGDIVV